MSAGRIIFWIIIPEIMLIIWIFKKLTGRNTPEETSFKALHRAGQDRTRTRNIKNLKG